MHIAMQECNMINIFNIFKVYVYLAHMPCIFQKSERKRNRQQSKDQVVHII